MRCQRISTSANRTTSSGSAARVCLLLSTRPSSSQSACVWRAVSSTPDTSLTSASKRSSSFARMIMQRLLCRALTSYVLLAMAA